MLYDSVYINSWNDKIIEVEISSLPETEEGKRERETERQRGRGRCGYQ
jgi:hypothetical protein